MERHNRHGVGNINLEIDDRNQNYININYIDNNKKVIEKIKNDITSNFKKIDDNTDDIAAKKQK